MADNAELGPLDVQIPDPKGGRHISALNAFKSLEFLREHLLETFDAVVRYNAEIYRMDLPHAISSATPLVNSLVNPLFAQLDLIELGQARRELAVGEDYSRRAMERYSYKALGRDKIEEIVRQLVWEYPSHGFVIDREEIENLGLNVERLDDKCTQLLESIISAVHSCSGVITEEERGQVAKVQMVMAQQAAGTQSNESQKEEKENDYEGGQRDGDDPKPTVTEESNGSNPERGEENVRAVNG